MSLRNHSKFIYGHIINDTNRYICFKEGVGPEKIAELPVGRYTLTKFTEIVASSLNTYSALDWAVTVDRSTRIITMTSSSTASILWASGSLFVQSPAEIAGFAVADQLNATSFVGSFASGTEYAPQFPLQDYTPSTNNKKMVNGVVSKSATGDQVSIQAFGVDRFMKCNIKWITNNPTDGLLRFNPQAVEEAVAFMDYIVEKNPIEFIENELVPETFLRMYLESSASDSNGLAYELTEYTGQDAPGFFETGRLNFKIINVE